MVTQKEQSDSENQGNHALIDEADADALSEDNEEAIPTDSDTNVAIEPINPETNDNNTFSCEGWMNFNIFVLYFQSRLLNENLFTTFILLRPFIF